MTDSPWFWGPYGRMRHVLWAFLLVMLGIVGVLVGAFTPNLIALAVGIVLLAIGIWYERRAVAKAYPGFRALVGRR